MFGDRRRIVLGNDPGGGGDIGTEEMSKGNESQYLLSRKRRWRRRRGKHSDTHVDPVCSGLITRRDLVRHRLVCRDGTLSDLHRTVIVRSRVEKVTVGVDTCSDGGTKEEVGRIDIVDSNEVPHVNSESIVLSDLDDGWRPGTVNTEDSSRLHTVIRGRRERSRVGCGVGDVPPVLDEGSPCEEGRRDEEGGEEDGGDGGSHFGQEAWCGWTDGNGKVSLAPQR